MTKKFIKIVCILLMLISTFSINNIQAKEVVFNNVDTLMIYNPLRMNQGGSYVGDKFASKATLSTGDMSNTIFQSNELLNLRSTTDGKIINYDSSNAVPYAYYPNYKPLVFDNAESFGEPILPNKKSSLNAIFSVAQVDDEKQFMMGGRSAQYKCLKVSDKSNIWARIDDPYYDMILKYADQLAKEVDEKVIANCHQYFGTGRFFDPANGAKLNVLLYDFQNGGVLGSAYPGDTLSKGDPNADYYSQYYNLDQTVIHLNSAQLDSWFNYDGGTLIFATLAHEYQHQIAFTDIYDNVNKITYNGLTSALWNGQISSMETWFNEAMSAAVTEMMYPSSFIKYGYLYSYNMSTSIQKGQSLYNFSPMDSGGIESTSVYGAVGLFAQYLLQFSGNNYIFKDFHDYWRSHTKQSEGQGLNLVVGPNLYNLYDSVEYSDDIYEQLSRVVNNNLVTEDDNLSKLVLDFYTKIITQDIKLDNPYIYNPVHNYINPLIYTGKQVDIEGGGRIIVKPNNDTYVVPADADPNLIYVGFDSDGNVTLKATLASKPLPKFYVTFYDENREFLDEYRVTQGQGIDYTAPEKQPNDKEEFTFDKWVDTNGNDVDLTNITQDIEVYAKYKSNPRKYTIQFVNEDKTVLQSELVEYGSTPVYKGKTPTKANSDSASFIFNDWHKKIEAVTKEETYIATFTEIKNSYTVNFYNDDNSLFTTKQVVHGDKVTVENPTKEQDEQYTYEFDKWVDSDGKHVNLNNITGNTNVYATYKKALRKYLVTFVNDDGSILKQERLEYGKTPEVNNISPSKQSSGGIKYIFIGWDQEIKPVTADVTYKATYKEALKTYTVKFYSNLITLLYSVEVEHGGSVSYTPPNKDMTNEFTFKFVGWTDIFYRKVNLDNVTSDIVAYARYAPSARKYQIRFVNYDGSELDVQELEYGAMPSYNKETPNRTSSNGYTYTFEKWDKEITKVKEDATYQAVFKEDRITFKVNIYDDSRNLIEAVEVSYGDSLTINPPTKNQTKQYNYSFEKWVDTNGNDVNLSSITSNLDVYPKYTEELRKYNVKFVNDNGDVLQEETLEYGTLPTYKKSTPTKNNQGNVKYIFESWDKDIVSVSEDVVYKAVYKEVIQYFTVKFFGDDKKLLATVEVEKGKTASYTAPEKQPTTYYSYTFDKWVDNQGKSVSLTNIQSDLNVYASYKQNDRKYSVKFYDGTKLLATKETSYGKSVSYTAPAKAQDVKYTYSFVKWTDKNGNDVNLNKITSDLNVYAKYNETLRKYIVKFVNYDGTLLQEESLNYGETPKYKGQTPTKEKSSTTTYTFSGWDNKIVSVSNNVTYKALYQETANVYTVNFYRDDLSLITSKQISHGKGVTAPDATKTSNGPTTYQLEKWVDSNGKRANFESMTSDQNFYARYKKRFEFCDVFLPTGNVAHAEAISWLALQNVTVGWTLADGNTYYRPYDNLTRSQMAAFLYRYAAGLGIIDKDEADDKYATLETSFQDIDAYAKYKDDLYFGMVWMAETKISTGYENGKYFKPDDYLTRGDMAAFLYRFAKLVNATGNQSANNPFVDVVESNWQVNGVTLDHYTGMVWMSNNGISSGWDTAKGKEFKPYQTLARADMAAFLYRLSLIPR